MVEVPEPREVGTSVQESLDILREERGYFITSCPRVGHPRGHFIMFFLP